MNKVKTNYSGNIIGVKFSKFAQLQHKILIKTKHKKGKRAPSTDLKANPLSTPSKPPF